MRPRFEPSFAFTGLTPLRSRLYSLPPLFLLWDSLLLASPVIYFLLFLHLAVRLLCWETTFPKRPIANISLTLNRNLPTSAGGGAEDRPAQHQITCQEGQKGGCPPLKPLENNNGAAQEGKSGNYINVKGGTKRGGILDKTVPLYIIWQD